MFLNIRNIDKYERTVTGIVYSPNELDAHGSFMTSEDIQAMAYSFMKNNDIRDAVDTEHNLKAVKAYPVESWISRDGEEYPVGSWIMTVRIDDDIIFTKVLNGKINAFSFSGMAELVDCIVEFEYTPVMVGETEPDTMDGHTHLFVVRIDEEMNVLSGNTSITNGHSHTITKRSITDIANKHIHRWTFKQ